MMNPTLQLLSADEHAAQARERVLVLANDADPLEPSLEGIDRVELHFPKFSDGRAFSQAFMLRRRRGFAGEVRATGDVLVDQLVQMQRTGFTSAVLRADQDPAIAARQFGHFSRFYQGDAAGARPIFHEGA